MTKVFDPQKSEKLISEERKKWLPPKKLLKACGLKTGDRFFDVGCGNGYFTLAAAEIVGTKGEVHGFDISPEMLEELSRRRTEHDIPNIFLHQVDKQGFAADKMPGLTDRADMLFFANILHEVEDPAEFFQSYLRFVNTETGRIVIIDWRKKEMEAGPAREERLGTGYIQNMLKDKGLDIIYSRVLNERYYMFVSVK